MRSPSRAARDKASPAAENPLAEVTRIEKTGLPGEGCGTVIAADPLFLTVSVKGTDSPATTAVFSRDRSSVTSALPATAGSASAGSSVEVRPGTAARVGTVPARLGGAGPSAHASSAAAARGMKPRPSRGQRRPLTAFIARRAMAPLPSHRPPFVTIRA